MKILVLNSGSSSQKLSLYEIGEVLPEDPPQCLWKHTIEGDAVSSRTPALEQAVRSLHGVDIVGHRVVHGGPHFSDPIVITPEVKSNIARAAEFAPLHNRAELEGMEIIATMMGPIPQVAVFDTAFHRTMPMSTTVYPGPYEWFENGIQRYGFHGINHRYCATRAARLLGRDLHAFKLVTCHLGNGCSLAAISDGVSVDTTMGFTPLEGLMMGTRSGSVDPGILTHLLRKGDLQSSEIDSLLNHNSGLLGISGISGDMRDILSAIRQGHDRAKLAFDIFIRRLQRGIGAMAAVLGGIDALVFSAGIGENSPEVRAAACEPLAFLGVTVDATLNARAVPDADVATPGSRVRVLVIRAQEDWEIAKECWRLSAATT